MTNEEKQALIEGCELLKYASDPVYSDIAEIALAALTAKPVAWRWEKNNGIYFECIKPIGIDSQPLFTTQPFYYSLSGLNATAPAKETK